MNEQPTTPGKTYSVHIATDCTVSDDSGWSKQLKAPEDFFTAHTSKVYLSVDDATVREVFKLAPIAFGGGGLPGWYDVLRSELAELLGEDNFSLTYAWRDDKFMLTLAVPFEITDEQMAQVNVLLGSVPPRNLVTEIDPFPVNFAQLGYLESTGSQVIELPYHMRDDLGVEAEYVDFYANNDTPFVSCSRYDGAPRFYLPYTSNSKVYIGWKDWITAANGVSNANLRSFARLNFKNDRAWSFKFGLSSYSDELRKNLITDSLCVLQLFCYNWGSSFSTPRHVKGRLFYCNVSLGYTIASSLTPALDAAGSPCLFDLVTRQPFYTIGTAAFIAGVETPQQLEAVLRGLPDRTGQAGAELHLRLSDELYEAAVASGIIEATATAKNWQIAYDPTTITEAA